MMTDIPEDISSFLREIDQKLKESGVKPHQRGTHAVMEFGRKFKISLPLVQLGHDSWAPPEVAQNNHYTQKIEMYFDELYGAGQLVDPSEKAKVAVLADGDIWQLPLPLIWGEAHMTLSRDFLPPQPTLSAEPVIINPCQDLQYITPKRLRAFDEQDLEEVGEMFSYGCGVKEAFDRFRKADVGFVEAENDWFTSVIHLTTRDPAFGQSWWSSLQMVEKFMKGLLRCIGDVPNDQIRKANHNLDKLHDHLKKSIPSLSLEDQITLVTCTDKVRYGEVPVLREDAYGAHKAAMNIVAKLGTIHNPNI